MEKVIIDNVELHLTQPDDVPMVWVVQEELVTQVLAAWMVIWWLGEAVPIPATALLPIPMMPLLEIAQMKPWYVQAMSSRGRTTVSSASDPIESTATSKHTLARPSTRAPE